MKAEVIGINGSSTGRSVDLPDDIFAIEPNEHAVYLAVKSIQANQRQGTHKAKERGEIKGSTKKIKKQKGTGTARAGSIKNPLFRGGGRIFGPRPRTYSVGLNKKVKTLARSSALSARAASGALKVIEDFSFEAPKTKEFASIVNSLEVTDKKALFVFAEPDKNLVLSARNISNASIKAVSNFSTLDVMRASQVFISEASVKHLKDNLSK